MEFWNDDEEADDGPLSKNISLNFPRLMEISSKSKQGKQKKTYKTCLQFTNFP